ncbi:glycosyltransferase family 4 protein [Eudoraea sp.]|uniref:glycosyltransferase family 4 protein n=1 Tax=Eudoraea sp. TaxID=1979955 RepID=UPI003C7657C2
MNLPSNSETNLNNGIDPSGKYVIFQLGSYPWQSEVEATSGSGILHEAQHEVFNSMDGVASYSIFPSGFGRQKNQDLNRNDVRIYEMDSEVPEYSHPHGHRWSGVSQEYVDKFISDHVDLVYDYMLEVENTFEAGSKIQLFIAHHTCVNCIIAKKVMEKRAENGYSVPPIVAFLHGTAMIMMVNEVRELAESLAPSDRKWPSSFHKQLTEMGIFNDYTIPGNVNLAYAISEENMEVFSELFPKFNKDRFILANPGFNACFVPRPEFKLSDVLKEAGLKHIGLTEEDTYDIRTDYKHMIVFVGQFVGWKRIDAVLRAARIWEAEFGDEVLTLIVGKQKKEYNIELQNLNKSLGNKNTSFVGPLLQPELAKLFAASSICTFPSKAEPFGMVLIESLACGVPVVGADSGGPRDFMTKEVGYLVPESDDIEVFSERLAEAVIKAIKEDWKTKMSEDCIKVAAPFSNTLKTMKLLEETRDMIG